MSHSIGIDLGTTNSVACVWRRGQLEIIPVDGRPMMPSAISIRPDGTVLVGVAAKKRAMMEPEQSVTSVKRVIGDGKTTWKIMGKTYTPIDISALVLRRLKEAASEYLGEEIREAIITVPAYFNNNQKNDTKLATEAAGLEVIQLLPEPTAAAVSYGLDKGKDQTILVYDLGGGTFDVSIVEVKGNRFEVVAVDGDFNLGGDDFDLLLVDYLIGLLEKKSKKEMGLLRSLLSKKGKKEGKAEVTKEVLLARQKLKEVAEQAKKELSESDATEVVVSDILGTSLEEQIEIEVYNGLIEPLVDKTIEKVKAVLKAAKVSREEIDRVILVGGSTRNRLVKKRLAEAIKEPWTSDRVDEVVSHGAAIVAGYASSPQEYDVPIELNNVTPFSLGVCAFESEDQSKYINSIIIEKNSPVPCVESKLYRTSTLPDINNQLFVYMLQGESRNPDECLVLGKYVFSDITHVPGRPAIVEIEYGYDKNGIITVVAKEKSSGNHLPLDVAPLSNDMSWLFDKVRLAQSFDGDLDRPYTKYAGKQKIPEAISDRFGNPAGNQYDLSEDNRFNGYRIAILHLYTREGFDFRLPEDALIEKGFEIHRWTSVPSISEFRKVTNNVCQLWIVSSMEKMLQGQHLKEIRKFFNSGRGIYIWGDNDPFYADANYVAKDLFDVTMFGNIEGNRTVSLKTSTSQSGFISHLITTGIENLYEGHTVATIEEGPLLKPLLYGSGGNVISSVYDNDGKRAIIDGGFTRLYMKWDTAGSARYVKNAASWLVNLERFGF